MTTPGPAPSRRAWLLLAAAALVMVGLVPWTDLWRQPRPVAIPSVTEPLVGTNYSHYAVPNCSLRGTGVVANYHRRRVRNTVEAQLREMRGSGIATLRLILWHQREPAGRDWGVLSSAGGELTPRDRDNLVGYLSDVRQVGFQRLTVSFAPMAANDPRQPKFDPSNERENWAFLRSTRALIKQFGPSSTHIDLLNEGTPAPVQLPARRQQESYLRSMYARYVQEYGAEDLVVSSIASQGPVDSAGRLQALLDVVRATGLPAPRWFEVHPGYTPEGVLANLHSVDRTLRSNGLTQPLVIGETAYDDAGVADAIMRFRRASRRPVSEVIQWPLTSERPCKDISVSPPYRADAYLAAFGAMRAPSGTPSPRR